MEKPIHGLVRDGVGVIAKTFCGVDPYRKGVKSDVIPGVVVTCKKCLKGQQS